MGLIPSPDRETAAAQTLLKETRMKAITVSKPLGGHDKNFYLSNLAPVNHADETPFGSMDAVLLVVLFVELAAVMRLFLAN